MATRMRSVTIQEACRILGKSDSTIRRYIREGRYHAVQVNRIWMITIPVSAEETTEQPTSQDEGHEQPDEEFMDFLREQIATKDSQINQLLEELRGMRQLALPPPENKPSWWRRLFGRRSDD